jgi:hypothetical protein
MSKKNRQSKDQKRKAKLAAEARRSRAREGQALPYAGEKWRKDEFLPLVSEAEVAIHEADVLTGRKLTDPQVKAALERLVAQLRADTLPPPEELDHFRYTAGEEVELIAGNVLRHWAILFERHQPFAQEDQVGVLRTLLNSINTWSSRAPGSRGYLSFVAGFLRKAGVNITVDGAAAEEDDEMLELGRDWCFDDDPEAEVKFRRLAEECIRTGQTDRVVSATQQLIGELGGQDPELMVELTQLSVRAQEAAGALPGRQGLTSLPGPGGGTGAG